MMLSYSRIKSLVPDYNRRCFTRHSILALTRKYNCEFVEKPLKKPGYYVTDCGGDIIFVDSRLKSHFWFEVAFHEIVHLLIHYPCDFLHSKQQFEAENLALIFMIPKAKLFEYRTIPFDEIDPRLVPYLIRRQQIYEIYRI
jgi:hypothetical protein